MNSYSFHETRRNPQTAWKVTFNLSFFSPVTHYKQNGSLSSYLSNDSKSKSVCNQRKGDKMDGTPFTKIPSLKQEGSFGSALFNDPMSEIIRNLERNPSIFRASLKEHLTQMSLAVIRYRMLLIALMQWILRNELLRRCKKLANLTSLYFTEPNQRVSKATTSIFYKHSGSRIQTA